jgi:aspartate/methionine/tyrosine aminotransferase
MFSERSARGDEPDPIELAIAERRARGEPVIDLTIADPLRAGLAPDPAILSALVDPAALRVPPEPLGLEDARAAIAGELAREALSIDPARVAVAATERELLGALFTILCDPGDEILVPEPSAIVLSELAHAAGVALSPYPLDGGAVDPAILWDTIGDRTRAIVLGNPQRWLGGYLSPEIVEAIAALGLPLIVDEALYSHPLEPPAARAHVASTETLTFAIDGLATRAALPQLALAWMTVCGPASAVNQALSLLRATLAASASTPVQLALGAILASADATRAVIHDRCTANLSTLGALTSGAPVEVPPIAAGWHACLRVRRANDHACELAARGVHVLAGARFDLDDRIAVSLLTPEDELRRGIAILRQLASSA